MASANSKKIFLVEELQVSGGGTSEEILSEFKWDTKTRSAPRHGWEYGVKLRTKREDYPGSDAPVEQVLGPNYEPFDIKGIWDDRYAGEGFAENQRVEFEKLVQRGNLTRLSFEGLQITGLITAFRFTYMRSYQTAYSFTFSPHYRKRGGDVRKNTIKTPKATDPVKGAGQVLSIIAVALARLDAAPAHLFPTDVFSSLRSQTLDWQNRIDSIGSTIDNRVLATQSEVPLNSVAAVAQGFAGLVASAAIMLTLTAGLRSDMDIAFEDAMTILTFEDFIRGMSQDARDLIIAAGSLAKDLALLADPQALAAYRPYAGESLYSISSRFFGTPFQWRAIAERNGLQRIELDGSEFLIIPAASKLS